MHVLFRQAQQANHDAAPKLSIKLGLVINDVHKALCEVELNMKVWEVGRNAAPQTLPAQTSCDKDYKSNLYSGGLATSLCCKRKHFRPTY